MLKTVILSAAVAMLSFTCSGQKTKIKTKTKTKSFATKKMPATTITPAAERIDQYLPLLKGKKVAMLVNHTSTIGGTHIVDALKQKGVDIRVVFGPEHGFRGDAPDGAKIDN